MSVAEDQYAGAHAFCAAHDAVVDKAHDQELAPKSPSFFSQLPLALNMWLGIVLWLEKGLGWGITLLSGHMTCGLVVFGVRSVGVTLTTN